MWSSGLSINKLVTVTQQQRNSFRDAKFGHAPDENIDLVLSEPVELEESRNRTIGSTGNKTLKQRNGMVRTQEII